MKKGKLILIPTPISEEGHRDTVNSVKDYLLSIDHYIVERTRTTRRFIKQIIKDRIIDDLSFVEINKHSEFNDIRHFLELLNEGKDIGLLSEAGCPGVADPGSKVVAWCHNHSIEVVPLIGPSSIIMALMSSGLNGQQFIFHGYLPNKQQPLKTKLKEIADHATKTGYTQIFMDAPYRNTFLLENCLNELNDQLFLCVASNLTSTHQSIVSKKVKDWRSSDIGEYHKQPAMILIGQSHFVKS